MLKEVLLYLVFFIVHSASIHPLLPVEAVSGL